MRKAFRAKKSRFVKSRALNFRHFLLGGTMQMKNLKKLYDEGHEKDLHDNKDVQA